MSEAITEGMMDKARDYLQIMRENGVAPSAEGECARRMVAEGRMMAFQARVSSLEAELGEIKDRAFKSLTMMKMQADHDAALGQDISSRNVSEVCKYLLDIISSPRPSEGGKPR